MVLKTNIVPSKTLKKVDESAIKRELKSALEISLDENNEKYHLKVNPPQLAASVDALNE